MVAGSVGIGSAGVSSAATTSGAETSGTESGAFNGNSAKVDPACVGIAVGDSTEVMGESSVLIRERFGKSVFETLKLIAKSTLFLVTTKSKPALLSIRRIRLFVQCGKMRGSGWPQRVSLGWSLCQRPLAEILIDLHGVACTGLIDSQIHPIG